MIKSIKLYFGNATIPTTVFPAYPYLTPIYDAFNDILGKENTEKYLAKGIIEIAPLAYMRGRTLSDAYVILDEAQNTTST